MDFLNNRQKLLASPEMDFLNNRQKLLQVLKRISWTMCAIARMDTKFLEKKLLEFNFAPKITFVFREKLHKTVFREMSRKEMKKISIVSRNKVKFSDVMKIYVMFLLCQSV
jgi:hypothetical protein